MYFNFVSALRLLTIIYQDSQEDPHSNNITKTIQHIRNINRMYESIMDILPRELSTLQSVHLSHLRDVLIIEVQKRFRTEHINPIDYFGHNPFQLV